MTETDLEFDDIFKELCPNEYNEFGLKREMRFISERIIVEYDPTDHLSVREIIHPMDAFRSHEPYFKHKLVDKSKKEFVTAIDFHEHITYFPYSKNTGDICLARYISNFNDINFTKISGQNLCSLPGETVYGLRVGRLDKGMLAVNHRTGPSVNSTVTVIDLVKPARNLAHYDSLTPVNTIDWVWHSPFLLAVGDDKALRIMDVRCPKAFNAVFFDGGVQKTALCSTRPLEIACWNGSNVLLYDVRRPEVPCAIYDIGLKHNEGILDMKFNPYITNELFVHTNEFRVYAMNLNPAHLVGGRAMAEKPYKKWQVITFKHIDRGCTATRHTLKRRETMPVENAEVPLLDYFDQYEAAKQDSQVPLPTHWTHPSGVDQSIFKKLKKINEVDYESYLYKAVERVSAQRDYRIFKPKVLYEAKGVDTFDFVFPGVNGIMCFDRGTFTYKIARSPKHYEGSVNPYAGSDSVFFYRGLQIQEMIPAQTLTMMCNRLEAGWNAYQVTERSLKDLAFRITEDSESMWSKWLRNSVIMQYGGKEYAEIGPKGLKWKDIVQLPDGSLPEVEIPPYDYARDDVATEEVCQMVAPFFRLFLPDPRPDLLSDSESETDEHNAPPPNPYEDDPPEPETGIPAGLSANMRTICKCHAKMRYYNKKNTERKYMYSSMGNTFFIGATQRILEKFFKLGWKQLTKPQILTHRLLIDTRMKRRGILDELPKFQRFKAREFQKRVLPPKLITDSSSIFMKPEYIKEREEKEKEMREKAAQPIQAPIGLSMPKSKKKEPKKAPVLSDADAEADPERARFLIRAAIQLADNNSSDDEVPPPQATPTPPPAPVPPGPQATSVRNEKDDFEYETPEDAYFGIKKKRMYVVYQPATAPLGLRRYKPDRLRENIFIRRLEHLMYWGRRKHERDVLYGRYEENDKRQSSVKERKTLDLKLALNNHMKVGWQTFYDKNFFFSNKCSYNQILRKAIQVYNRMCHDEYNTETHVRHERMLFGVKPRYLLNNPSMDEVLELRKNCTIIENTTIETYNHFMNYLQAQLPYQMDPHMFMEKFEGDVPYQLESQFPIEEKKQTAVYDEDEKYMFPMGRLRFCEFEIPPNFMREIEERRKPVPPKKHKSTYLEDYELPSSFKTDYSGLRRTRSSPDLCLDISATQSKDFFDVMNANVMRCVMGRRLLQKLKEAKKEELNFGAEHYEPVPSENVLQYISMKSVSQNKKLYETFSDFTKFIEWDSPMIADTDRETGRKFMRRVVPFKEPQPPRQLEGIDPWFEFITIDVMLAAAKNLHVSYIINDPILRTWPGLQILDEGRDEMFTLCPKVPRKPNNPLTDFFKPPLLLPSKDAEFFTHFYTETLLKGRIPGKNRIRPPVYEEHSINIPPALIELLKPAFYGYFDIDLQNRYDEEQALEMKNRRELQQAIFQRRVITFRQPVIEETEQELEIEENLNVEEDDLKTSSEESEEEEAAPIVTRIVKLDEEESGANTEKEPEVDEDGLDFWKIFKVTDDDVEDKVESLRKPVQRKKGMFYTGAEETSYNCFNPHTRQNQRKVSREEYESDEPRQVGSVLTNLYGEKISKEKQYGDCPLGSPRKSSLRVFPPEVHPIPVPISEIAKQTKTVTWGNVIEHRVPARPPMPVRYKTKNHVEVDTNFFRDLYNVPTTRRVQSTDDFQNYKPIRKNSDPTVVHYRGLPRRASLDQFYNKRDAPATCSACIQEPWPTKEECIVCHPDTTIYRCTNIVNLNDPCNVCGSNIYKFSCMNYEYNTQYTNKIASLLNQIKLKPVDEEFRAKLAVHNEPVKLDETPAVWSVRPYKAGNSAVDTLLARADQQSFKMSQNDNLSTLFHREFHWVTWRMDDDKAEKVVVSEEFDVAFDRDADIDMMRDTMNTISQDGDMDMMTTYDQRTGMRIRRWISYAALATRVQKQTDKARYRKRLAEREARILAGEISVKPALLNELKKKAKEKEVAANKATEMDEQKREEERRRQYKLWKKLPIPQFPEDPKKEMPNFAPPKFEDWLESSGSEDELPPIRSRMLSKELKEFIETIRVHMEKKPKNFEGLRVNYGKLFERRPILKNDIVLVTKKKNLRRKPPPFRIQRIPLDETWLNSSFTVAFLPPAMETHHPKDPKKWTVPFYNSHCLELTAKETKDRTFRPPTPPPTIKEEYKKMKHLEKAYYHQKRVKLLCSMKKAKLARQLRFHRKLYGHAKVATNAPKAWTNARHRLFRVQRGSKTKSQVPQLPRVPDYKKYVFSYYPKRLSRKLKLADRQQSRISSPSDSEYCPIVKVPRVKRKTVEVQEMVPVQDKTPNKIKAEPVGLIDRKKKQLKREAPPAIFQPASKILKLPETGYFVKREFSLEAAKPVTPKKPIQQVTEKASPSKTVEVEKQVKTATEQLKRQPIIKPLKDESIDNFSKGVPAISLVGKSDESRKRDGRKKEQKTTVNSKPDIEGKSEKKSRKLILRRTQSVPVPHSRKSREKLPVGRSFSADSGKRFNKTLKKITQKHKRKMQKKKQEEKVAAFRLSQSVPDYFSDSETHQKSISKPEDVQSTSEQQPETEMQTQKDLTTLPKKTNELAKFAPAIVRRTKKLKKAPTSNSKPSKSSNSALTWFKSKVRLCRSSRAKGTHTERPLQPRWLPSDHETDRKGRKAASQYRFQHMRTKRYNRKRQILHQAPTRSRVLNTIRRMNATERKNREMKYKEPMNPKISDLYLNPWKPFPKSKRPIPFQAKYRPKKPTKKPTKPQPMSWKQMLEKLADYNVSIKRIRLSQLKRPKPKVSSKSVEPAEQLLEIVVEPTLNLKSCLKREKGRRSLKFVSQQTERKDSFIGFNKTLKLVKAPVSAKTSTDTASPESPKSVPSLLDFNECSIGKDNWLTSTRKTSKSKEEKPAAKKEQSPVIFTHTVQKEERIVTKPSTPPIGLLKPVPTAVESSKEDEDTEDEVVAPFAPAPAPPPKMPADQQWRAAMMARRYMSASKPVYAPSPTKKEEAPKPESSKEEKTGTTNPAEDKTPTKTVTVSEPKLPTSETIKPVEQPKPVPSTAPTQLPRMTATKARDRKPYEAPVAKPKATAPPPVTPKDPSGTKQQSQTEPSNGLKDKDGTKQPESSVSSSSKQKDAKKRQKSSSSPMKSEAESSLPAQPNPQAENSTSAGPSQNKKTSFFTAIFGRKRSPTPGASTSAGDTGVSDPPSDTAADGRSSPILPRIKQPETGKLSKRSPTSDAPRPPLVDSGEAVKFVDGKPIYNAPTYRKSMSQRRRKKADASSENKEDTGAKSSGDQDSSSATSGKSSEKLSSVLKQTSTDVTSQEAPTKSSSGKTVRFGSVSYEPPKPPALEPVAKPPPEPKVEISFETLAEEMLKEQREKAEEEAKKLEKQKAAEQVSPSTSEPEMPTKAASKLTFFGLSPFGKITPKKNTTPSESWAGQTSTPSPSTSGPSTSGPTTSKDKEPSSPGPSSSTVAPSTANQEASSSEKSGDNQRKSRPTRKTSVRRQLKMDDPSPLQLSDDPSLPRPAQPSPEKPPQLEVPTGVQTYNPPSQRKYYTRLGREWKPPKSRAPICLPRVEDPAPEPLPAALPAPVVPVEKKKKRRKRKPKPVETTLVLDGTKHFSKLTADNLQLLDREFNVKTKPATESLEAFSDTEDDHKCKQHSKLLATYRDLKKNLKNDKIDEKMVKASVAFDPMFTDSVITKMELLRNKPKFETAAKKLRRMANNRRKKIDASGVFSMSKRDAALQTVRHVRKVRFFQTHKKHMMPTVLSNFKPKSILKAPKPPVTWFYRVDCEGNKLYMKRFGPSAWQKRMDEKLNPKKTSTWKKKKPTSYLRRWAKVMNKIGKDKMLKIMEEKKLEMKPGAPTKPRSETLPNDVLVDVPRFEAPPPSRSLSSTSVSTNASLNSLLDALNAVDSSSSIPTNLPIQDVGPKPQKPDVKKASAMPQTSTLEPAISKQYPIVYIGATIARSPSTSTSLVNINEREAVSSLAQDGSEILEYVGQEETPAETVKRRFDPFVRPISALLKAFSSNSTEVGLEAETRGRRTERTLGGLFGRSSPTMPEFSSRHHSSSPTRRRVIREPITSISQGSSAEDILALMQAQPNALEKMEESARPKFPPLELPDIIPNGKPMWKPQFKLKNSLYTQFRKLKEESRQRKLLEYLDYHYGTKTNESYSTLRSLVTFNLDQYMRTTRYPRPSLNINLLGKYDAKSLRISCSSRSGIRRSTAIIVKKIKKYGDRFENVKKSVQSSATNLLPKQELIKRAKKSMKLLADKKPRKIRVLYKFKRTCIKYRVQVTVPKKTQQLLTSGGKKAKKTAVDKNLTKPLTVPIQEQERDLRTEEQDNFIVSDNEEDVNNDEATEYDGDNDDDVNEDDSDFTSGTKQVVIRKNQRRQLLRKYFHFAVKMARKIARRSVGVQKPFVFYAFISQMRARMHHFMDIRRKDNSITVHKGKQPPLTEYEKVQKLRKKFDRRKKSSRLRGPLPIRESLKYGSTAQQQVVVEHSKFNFLKLNAKLETFFECLDEYIDVGTPIKLVFRPKTTLLPVKMFEVKTKLVDPVYYTSPSPCNTDSDFSDDTPENPKLTEQRRFFEREGLESTYHVKGLPGLIYLARLVQERIGDDVERNIPFKGPGMETSSLVVYMTPIRRLMLNSIGLRMPDRLNPMMLSRYQSEKFELWFGRLFRMLCYGRGDFCKYIIDKIALGQGPPNKKYEKMDITYQAHIVHKLYKKMIYLENGREARLAINKFMNMGLEIEENPFSKPFKMGQYDRMLYGDPQPWTRDNWIEACDQFLNYSTTKEDIVVACQASLVVMRMIFVGGYSQDIVDQLITMQIPLRDKLLFIINLTPPDNLVENIVKMFHTVRGLDRLPFVGLGYHADPLRVLFEEAIESGDPQLIAHFVRIGRCLDRRSREPMMTDCGSEHIQNRDFGHMMAKVFDNGKERRPFGPPTMDEMFPFRYVRHQDGTEVTESTEELANIMECEVTRYMAILELTKGAAVTKGDLDHNPKFNTYPHKFFFDVLCTGCKMNVSKGRNLGRLGRTLCVSTMPLIEQDKDKKRWPNAKTMSPRLTFENYIETLDPTENKMLMAKDIEEEKTDITVQVLPSRFGCFQCRFSLPRCCVCMCPYLNDHMDYALKEFNERFSLFSVCNICNHGGHVNHIALWFETEKYCPVAGCDCRCQRSKQVKNLKGRLRRHMLLSANMRAKSHLCNPECAIDADVEEGFLPDPDLALLDD